MAKTRAQSSPSLTAGLSERLQDFFQNKARRLGRTTQFVQRKSKLTASLFAQIWVLGLAAAPRASLEGLAATAADLGLTITGQGLDKRLTPKAVNFFQQLFAEALQLFRNALALQVPLLQQFHAIYLQDSSVITLPASLQQEFPGCGGDGAAASLKVHLRFEFLRGNLHALTVQPGRVHDQAGAGPLDYLQAGDLLLRDLGYFQLAAFREIAAKKAYFISRLHLPTTLYDAASGAALALVRELRDEPRTLFEREVLLGAALCLPVRAIFVHLPQAVADARRRKAKATAQKQGRTLSAETLYLLEWSIFLTNVPVTMLSTRQVVLLYGVRWQIELLFKLWKSECALAHIAGWRRARVLCELYAKMIGLVLLQWLIAPLRLDERELSAPKAAHLWQRYMPQMVQVFTSRTQLAAVLEMFLTRLKCLALKDQRKTDRSTLQQLKLESVPALG